MDIVPVGTRADLEDFHAVEAAAMAHDFVGLPADPVDEWAPSLEQPEIAGERVTMWLGREDGVPVGVLSTRVPLLDNLAVVNGDVAVHPDHRRRGYGRQLAHRLLDETRALGRTRVFSGAAHDAGRALLAELGFRPVIDEVRRLLDLQEFPPAPRPPAPQGYRVVEWLEQAPDELVDGVAYLNGRMTLDMPMGDMDYEPEKWDAQRYREREQAARDRKRLLLVAAAVADDGTVAGITEIAISPAEPEVGYQWDTIVDPDHRGRGLGLLLKQCNHAQLVEAVPGVRWLNTWNAATNGYMIAVNEAVGYRPMEIWTEHQLDL